MHAGFHSATDYLDEVLVNGRFFEKHHLDTLFAGLAALGIREHEWVISDRTTLYADYPAGFDLLAEAVKAAHRHGIAFYAVFKPFERIPHYAPHAIPDAAPYVWSDFYGTLTPVPPFIVQHPEYCLQRDPADVINRPGPVTAIRLVKADTAPTRIKAGQVSIWTAQRLGAWTRYAGAFTLTDGVADRSSLIHRGKCRVVTLAGLEIPEDHRYIEVRFSDDWTGEEFTNHPHSIIELAGADGADLPVTPAHRGSSPNSFRRFTTASPGHQINPCMQNAQYAEFVRNADLDALWTGHREIGWPWSAGARVHAHQDRYVTVARGLLERIPVLHPGYPAVRRHWLECIRGLLDAGVDGVNIRPSSHYRFRTTPPEAYGFNAPALQAVQNPRCRAAVAEANGNFFTGFLREARQLIAGEYGKLMGVHVLASCFRDRDENDRQLDFALFDWQWREWVRDIADYVEFRGMMGFRPLTARLMAERVAYECRRAGKPFVLQSDRRLVAGAMMPELRDEARWALNHPDVTAYQLYETATFSRIDACDRVTCDPAFCALVKELQPDNIRG